MNTIFPVKKKVREKNNSIAKITVVNYMAIISWYFKYIPNISINFQAIDAIVIVKKKKKRKHGQHTNILIFDFENNANLTAIAKKSNNFHWNISVWDPLPIYEIIKS